MNKVHCPVCGQSMGAVGLAEWPEYPFCSPRCRLVDLGRWLNESYRIPVPAADTETVAESDENVP